MTTDQIVILLNWLIAVGIPLAVAFVTRSNEPARVKALVNLGLSLVGTALVSIVASLVGHQRIDWFTVIFAFVTSFVVSGASYARLWKPTGIAANVAQHGRRGTAA